MSDSAAAKRQELVCRCVSGHHTCGLLNPEEALILALARAEELEDALRQIAAPKRPDGTYNLSREACEQIARETLQTDRYQDGGSPHNSVDSPRDTGMPGGAT